MALDSYAELKSEIAKWLDNDDISAYIPTFIQAAEEMISNTLRVREMIQVATLPAGVRNHPYPDDFAESVSLETTAAAPGPVVDVTLGTLQAKFYREGVGEPYYYARADTIRLDIVPANPLQFTYFGIPEALSDSLQYHSVFRRYPFIYLYGSLVESAPFLIDDARIGLWAGQLNTHMQAAGQKRSPRSVSSSEGAK